MKNLKQIITVIGFVLLTLYPNIINAQSVSKLIDYTQLKHKRSVIEFKSNGNTIMAFDITKNNEGITSILPNPPETLFKDMKIELYDGKKLVAQYIDNEKGGPNGLDNLIYWENEIPYKTLILSKKEWWIIAAAVALCCIEVSGGYNQNDGWHFEAGFDCDCLSISLRPSSTTTASSPKYKIFTIKGKKYKITKIKFIPLNQKNTKKYLGKLSITLN